MLSVLGRADQDLESHRRTKRGFRQVDAQHRRASVEHLPQQVVLAEQTDEWTEARRYMGLELLAKARLTAIDREPSQPADDATAPPKSIAA